MTTQTKRTLSTHAHAAKNIRDFAKSIGVKCKARSESYSMGSSVDWYVEDLHPDVFGKIDEYARKHQYGHFDGMTDCYEMSNTRSDLPQVKHVFSHNNFSEELKQKAFDWLKEQAPGNAENLPENYSEARELNFFTGERDYNHNQNVQNQVYAVLRGDGFNWENWREFWQSIAPKVAEIKPASVEGVTIEEHTHTKKGFQMFICICPKMNKEEFFNVLDQAKSAGGWYSRKWGSTPAGFAFKELSQAEQFAASLSIEETAQSEKPKPRVNHAEKLRGLADKLQKQIEDKRAPRQTNTPKRLKEANIARNEADRLERTQTALYKLADLHDADNVPHTLAAFTTKKAVYDAMAAKSELIQNGFHTYYSDTNKPSKETPETIALWALLDTKDDTSERELQHKIDSIQFSKIPGYFPTPEKVISMMLDNINIKPGDKVLEPSAGSGAILDAIKQHEPGANLECCEINPTLREILTLKGYTVKESNFLELNSGSYDAVLMNPPFEKLQDAEHIQKAYNMLKPGGRLVAIMSPSAFFRMDKKSESFRSWFYTNNGLEIDLPENSFKESGTGVNTKLIVIDRGL